MATNAMEKEEICKEKNSFLVSLKELYISHDTASLCTTFRGIFGG